MSGFDYILLEPSDRPKEDTFRVLMTEVDQHTSLEQTTRYLASTLQNAVKNRHKTNENPMVLDCHPLFDLMCQIGMIDERRGTRTDSDEPNAIRALTSAPHYWFLSEKAINYHSELAHEGYYDKVA